MTLVAKKIRVHVSGKQINRFDGNYGRTGTDLRYVVIPRKDYELRAVGKKGAKPSNLAASVGAEAAINFCFINWTDLALLGANVVDGNPFTYDLPVTSGRPYIYRSDNTYGIGRPSKIGGERAFKIQGQPELLRNGEEVILESIKTCNTKSDVLARCQHTAFGIMNDGNFMFLVSDGRLSSDVGLFASDVMKVMKWLGCKHAIMGDSGGSSILYLNGQQEYLGKRTLVKGVINQATNRRDERPLGMALCAVRK